MLTWIREIVAFKLLDRDHDNILAGHEQPKLVPFDSSPDALVVYEGEPYVRYRGNKRDREVVREDVESWLRWKYP